MTLDQYKKAILNLDYVVQRNWEEDPYTEGDLDLFVSLEHYNELARVTEAAHFPFKVDIRTHGDGYYPDYICDILLFLPRNHDGWRIPTPRAHFLSLYYHNLVHKGDGRYSEKLRKIFLEWIPPVQPEDKGVGFHIP